MEELRSTDILDKEIQADARKKAERILSKAELDGQQVLADVAARVEKARKDKTALYEQKIAAFEKDKESVVPLEKQRFSVSFIDSAVKKGISDYIESLPEQKCLELLMKQLEKYKDIISGRKMNASVYGFSIGTAQQMLVKVLGSSLASCTELKENGDSHAGIILESADQMIRCRLTLSEIADELQTEKRAELASALFGGRLSE
jgi:V/A-type H+/Na+-transporting ATPase subunit E